MKRLVFCLLVLMICQQTSAQDLSAMSFNIRFDNPNDNLNQWCDRKADVVSVLKNYKPSFIGIQEGLVHQLEYIDENMHDYKYIGVGRGDGRQKGEYTAIFFDSIRLMAKMNTIPKKDQIVKISKCGISEGSYFFHVI